MTVVRLPVQHKKACPNCERMLGDFDDVRLSLPAAFDVELLSVVFEGRCKCGERFVVRKTPKSSA